MDFSELVNTLWWRRPGRLLASGPSGMLEMAAGMQTMMAPDVRLRSATQPIANPLGYQVDVLIHEVISEGFQAYHKRSHTPASDLGRLASAAGPGLLALYHGLYYGLPEQAIVDEVRATCSGKLVLADDLDIF